MLKRIWSAVVAILLVSASTAPARACTRPRGPLECVASVALTVTVDGASVFPGESARAAPLERRLLAVASRALAEAGVASDPSGRDLHLDVFREGDDLIVVASPRGEEATGSRAEADWQVQKTVEPADGEEAATLAEIENSFLRALSGTIGSKESCLPDRYSSAHGRFVFEIPSENPLARARYLRALLWKEGEAGLDLEPRGSLFERSASGREELRSTFRLPREALPGSFLVADDGRFVVEAWRWASVGDSEDALILFWSDGTEIRRLSLEDLLTPGDLQQVRNQYATLTATALDDENDRLVIAISRGDVTGTIEIDLETGELTEPKHDHLTQ
ncbi:MAG TPA: hypothetical protein VN783_05265, partial [Thermoanaerobaculia bacterium]|nr:hypothetical protein [Thermoanaerobaculia bacterium]